MAPASERTRPTAGLKVYDTICIEQLTKSKTIDFMLTRNRDKLTANRFLIKAIGNNGILEKITIDGSVVNKSALEKYKNENGIFIEICHVKYLSEKS